MSKPLRTPYKTSLPQSWQSCVLGLPTSTLPSETVNLGLMQPPENLTHCLHKRGKITTARLTARCAPHSVRKIVALRRPDARRGP